MELFKRYMLLFEECLQILTAILIYTGSQAVFPHYVRDSAILELFIRHLTLDNADPDLRIRSMKAIERAFNYEFFCGNNEDGPTLNYSVKDKVLALKFESLIEELPIELADLGNEMLRNYVHLDDPLN